MLFEENVERIAKAWYEDGGEPRYNWDNAHPEDKDAARWVVRFVMKEMGFRE